MDNLKCTYVVYRPSAARQDVLEWYCIGIVRVHGPFPIRKGRERDVAHPPGLLISS